MGSINDCDDTITSITRRRSFFDLLIEAKHAAGQIALISYEKHDWDLL